MLTKRASATIEYMAMITFILAAFFIFQHYIVRGFSGRWKAVGDTFGHGKQYDPKDFGPDGQGGGTFECYFDSTHCDPDNPPCVPGSDPCEPSDDPAYCPEMENRINSWVDKRCFDNGCNCMLAPDDPEYWGECLYCIKDCVNTSICG